LNVLRIYFSDQWQKSDCPWALCDESGRILQQGVSPLSKIPRARDCVGILAADRVLIFTTQKPPGNKRRWQAALPFIAEEYTLTDPDDIHAVPIGADSDDMMNVLVVGKSWLGQILTATNAAGIQLRQVVAESLLPKLQPDSWTLVWNEHDAFLRTANGAAQVLDAGNWQTPPLALTLSLAKAALPLPKQIELRFSQEVLSALPAWKLPVPLVMGERWDWRQAPLDGSPNLLWGELTPSLRLFDGLAKLRPLLPILLVAFFIEVIASHLEWAVLARERNTLTIEIAKVFHSTFGEDSEMVDATLQMQRNLSLLRHTAGLVDDSDFLALLDRASQALATLKPEAIRSMSYESGKLELELKLTNAVEFQMLEQKFKKLGLIMRTGKMQSPGDGTQANITLFTESMR
jgi:type II secretion system protein L